MSFTLLLKKLKANLIDDWYNKEDPTSKDRARLMRCSYLSNTIRAFIGGTFWSGMLTCLHADDAFVGTIGMIQTAANVLQVFSPVLMERFPKRKKLIVSLRGCVWFMNVVLIGLIPLFLVAQQTKLLIAAATVLCAYSLNSFIQPGLAVWHMKSVPPQNRRGYFSFQTMTASAVVAVCNLIGAYLVDAFAPNTYYGLLVLRGITAILCAIEIIGFSKVPEYPYDTTGFTVKDLIVKPFSEKKYLLTVSVTFLWNFFGSMPSGYYGIYLLQDAQYSYSALTLVQTMNVPIVLLLTPVWKKILNKRSWFSTLYLAMTVYAFVYPLQAFVTKDTRWIYTISQLMIYVISIGVSLSFTGIPYVNMPKENQTVFYGFYSTCMYLGAFFGNTFGKYFILSTNGHTLTLFGMQLCNKQYIMLLTAAGIFIGSILIRIITKRMKSMTEG